MIILERRAIAVLAFILLLSLVTPGAPGFAPARAQGGGFDLALVINGSGSISPSDFTLQKEGIKAALQNPIIVPRDGRLAIALVQYANRITQVHIPYTIIDSEADVASLVSQVDRIAQIGGSTNPGDGVNAATGVLNADGMSVNQQVICLSTDGLPNAGADVATALDDAKASDIGLDRFSVIAIEDPPFFFEPDFQAFYGPLVFGGGAVTVVRNSAEYANILGATCLPAELELIGLEVNQTIQDWSDSVQVIENKTTYVRAHIQTNGTEPGIAVARLRGFSGGTELAGSPLTATNPNGSITAPPRAVDPQEITDRRSDLEQSLNFRLPQAWLSGTVDLRVEGVGGGLDCRESADSPDDCSVQVTFNSTDQLKVKFVRVKWGFTGLATHQPTADDIIELANRLTAIYPIDSLDWTTGQLTSLSIGPPNLEVLNFQLQVMRFFDCLFVSNCNRLYYGNIVDAPEVGGLANGIPGTVASGDMGAEANVHAHELGHLLGRFHAEFCSATGGAPFPYIAFIGGQTVATIGPMNLGDDRLIFGLDSHRMRALSPFQNFELMSYCTPLLWISDFTYDAVRTQINNTFSGTSMASGPTQDFMIFNGLVNFENDTVEFRPFGIVSSPVSPPMPPLGDYTLQILDAGANILQEIPFQPIRYHAFGGPDPGTGLFIIPIPADPTIVQVRVLLNGNALATISASPNPPTVDVVFPNGGESLGGSGTTLQWTGNDPDGDPLSYLVQYSRDGGATWETLVADWPDQTYDIGLEFLGETINGLIRVMASDGFNATTDDSDGAFSTPNNPPMVSILSPAEGDLFVGVQQITFDGFAMDREDGLLSGGSLAWTSDRDGFLDTGETINLEATELSEGDHTITLTATDGGGLTAGASVNIRIFRIAPQPNRPPIADAGVDQILECAIPQAANVTLNGTASVDPDGDDLTFSWSAPGIAFDDPTSPTPMATFPLGTTTATLVVDDGLLGSSPDAVEISVQDTSAPTLSAEWIPLDVEEDEGKFILEFGATDVCDPDPQVTGVIETPNLDGFRIKLKSGSKVKIEFDLEDGKVVITGLDPKALLAQLRDFGGLLVENGQRVKIELEDADEGEFKFEFAKDGTLKVAAPSASLAVTGVDASGNTASAQARPQFSVGEDDDEDKDGEEDEKHDDYEDEEKVD